MERTAEPPSTRICPYVYWYMTKNTDGILKNIESFGQLIEHHIIMMWSLLLNTEITQNTEIQWCVLYKKDLWCSSTVCILVEYWNTRLCILVEYWNTRLCILVVYWNTRLWDSHRKNSSTCTHPLTVFITTMTMLSMPMSMSHWGG